MDFISFLRECVCLCLGLTLHRSHPNITMYITQLADSKFYRIRENVHNTMDGIKLAVANARDTRSKRDIVCDCSDDWWGGVVIVNNNCFNECKLNRE